MNHAMEPGLVLPTPQTARIFGVLNIVIGTITLFMAYYAVFMLVLAPTGAAVMKVWQRGLERQMHASQDAQIRRLVRLRDVTKSAEKRAQYESELTTVRARPTPNLGPMSMGFNQVEEPTIRGYSMADAAASAAIHIALLGAGFGLLRLREWGRKLSLILAVARIACLLVGLVYMVAVIFPIQSRMMREQMEITLNMQTGGGARPAPFNSNQMAQLTAISSTGTAVLMVLISGAYPVVSLWYLTRPGVRAACLHRAKPVDPMEEPFL